MSSRTIQITLPQAIYEQVEQRAHRSHRSFEDELITILASFLNEDEQLADKTVASMTQLPMLNDKELWQAARMVITTEENKRMEVILDKRRVEALTEPKQREMDRRLKWYEHVMLVRTQAAVLLRQRGYDVSSLLQPPASS